MVAGGPSDRLVRAAAVAALLTLGLAMGVAHFLQPGRTEFLGPGPAAAAILEVVLAAVLLATARLSHGRAHATLLPGVFVAAGASAALITTAAAHGLLNLAGPWSSSYLRLSCRRARLSQPRWC